MIAAVVLAAGGSSRLGRAKQLIRRSGIAYVRHAVTSVLDAGCDPVRVVVGASADQVSSELQNLEVEVVNNAAWEAGVSGSIRRGVEELVSNSEVKAVVISVCDQPALSSVVIRRLMAAWDGTPQGRVACGYSGTLGVPALFGRAVFPQLMKLEGDRGAQALLLGRDGTTIVDWAEGAGDIDDAEDLARSFKGLS